MACNTLPIDAVIRAEVESTRRAQQVLAGVRVPYLAAAGPGLAEFVAFDESAGDLIKDALTHAARSEVDLNAIPRPDAPPDLPQDLVSRPARVPSQTQPAVSSLAASPRSGDGGEFVVYQQDTEVTYDDDFDDSPSQQDDTASYFTYVNPSEPTLDSGEDDQASDLAPEEDTPSWALFDDPPADATEPASEGSLEQGTTMEEEDPPEPPLHMEEVPEDDDPLPDYLRAEAPAPDEPAEDVHEEDRWDTSKVHSRRQGRGIETLDISNLTSDTQPEDDPIGATEHPADPLLDYAPAPATEEDQVPEADVTAEPEPETHVLPVGTHPISEEEDEEDEDTATSESSAHLPQAINPADLDMDDLDEVIGDLDDSGHSIASPSNGLDTGAKVAAIRISPDGSAEVISAVSDDELALGDAEDFGEESHPDAQGFGIEVVEYEEADPEDIDEGVLDELIPEPLEGLDGPSESELQEMFALATSTAETNMNEATALFSDVLDADHNHLEALLRRGRLYLDLGDYSRAVSDFMRAEEVAPDNAEIQYCLGDFWYARKDYNRSVNYYTAALGLNPNHAMAFCRRGMSHYYKKNYVGAIDDLNRAQHLDAQIPNVQMYLRRARKRAGAA